MHRSFTFSLYVICIFLLYTIVIASKDYYSILDVPRDAPKSQIKRHFKKLSRVYHPDKNSGDPKAAEKFMEIANAYEVLMDDEKRSIYDRYGEDGLKQNNGQPGGHHGFHDAFDIFAHFFGGGGGGGQRRAQQQEKRGPDMVVPIEIALEDIYTGAEIELDVSKQVLCEHCHGSGARNSEDVTTCNVCGGRGMTIRKTQLGPGIIQQVQQTCHKCGGKGKTIAHVCPVCSGKKVKRGNENYTLHIEKGIRNGHQIVFDEEADEYPDAIPGNIIFKVKAAEHPVFERRGDNLYTKQEITLIEALAGFTKTIKHLDKTDIELIREGVTQYGFVQTIKGQGMPIKDNTSKHGDLYIEYHVIFPTEIDQETIEYLKRGSTFDTNKGPHFIHQEL